MIYLFSFAISGTFAYFAKKCNNRLSFILFSFFSIAVIVLLAGLRDYSIGIDVENYYSYEEYWGNASTSATLSEYMHEYLAEGHSEPLFALIFGVVAQTTGEFRVFLFLAHAVIITGIYVGSFRFRKHVDPVIVLLLFYLFFFNHSLNIIRQYIGMAIVFAALGDLEQKKYIRFCIIVGITYFIHNTAVLALGQLVICLIIDGKYRLGSLSSKVSMQLKNTVIFGLLFVMIAFFPQIVNIMIELGFLNDKYLFFITGTTVEHSTIVTALLAVEVFIIILFRNQMHQKSHMHDFLFTNTISYMLLMQLTLFINFGKRIAAWFSFANLITIALLIEAPKKRENKALMLIGVFSIALLYWVYMYVFRNASETFPYVLGV